MERRDFLKASVGALALATALPSPARSAAPARLEGFPPGSVRLLPSRFRRQVDSGRDFYLSVRDEDFLHGFRKAAGLAAPGVPLGGWCGVDSGTVLGQWLSGMSRLAAATGEGAIREKAVNWYEEWRKTLGPGGDPRMGHYRLDKLVGGLVDLASYARHDTGPVLERVLEHAMRHLERPERPRENLADPSHPQHYYGLPQEWYTLAENLYRAYVLTGEPRVRSFAEEWLYHAYWAKFARSSSPTSPGDAHGVHAYSHTNTFSSAAMAYEVTGDPRYLEVIENAYQYLQRHQCYATGGFGPNERFMALDGSLGRALETRSDTAEIVCGSWAGFKLSRYLMGFTGEARYGDWIERLLYNGVGAALPIAEGGRNFYYADYRVGGGMKVYNWDRYTCCSGTYIQNLAAYHDLVYFQDGDGVYVNLYLPSEVRWRHVTLTQDTRYPDDERIAFRVEAPSPVPFSLRFRVPGWTAGIEVQVNGERVAVEAKPGSWASLSRTWSGGDHVAVRMPLPLRMEPVDRQHPHRVAVVRGPVVLVLEGAYHDPRFSLPMRDEELDRWLVPEEGSLPRGVWSTGLPPATYPTSFRVAPPDGRSVRLRFRPYYEIAESYPYFMYFDRDQLPWGLW